MVKDYTEKYYNQAHINYTSYSKEKLKISKELAAWKEHIKKIWSVKVIEMSIEGGTDVVVGSILKVTAKIDLGAVSVEDVHVELYFGSVDKMGDINDGVAVQMERIYSEKKGIYSFIGQMLCLQSGRFGYSIRVIPHNKNMPRKFDPDLPFTWA
jgi:starch phosphorylase